MRSSNKLVIFFQTFITALLTLLFIASSHASDVQGPADKIINILDTVIESADSRGGKQSALDNVTTAMESLEENFAITEIAVHVFGPPWHDLSRTEKNDFIHYLKIRISQLISEKTMEFKEGRAQLVQEKIKGKRAVVKLEVSLPQKSSSVVYNLIQSPSGWKIFDINLDGVSLLRNYIYQIRSIYTRSGYTGVMEEMKKKINIDD